MYLYEGISINDSNELIFNWDKDDSEKDIINLLDSDSHEFNEDGYRYIYGYKYNSKADGKKKKIIRDYLKNNPYSNESFDFIENGILKLNDIEPINNFDVFVDIESSNSKLVNEIELQLTEYSNPSSHEYTTFHLIKELCNNISFNKEKAIQILKKIGYKDTEISKIIRVNEDKLEDLKLKGKLFEMKRFVPIELRSSFENFLKFKTEEDKELYKTLQGANVLVVDDFLTSGATVKEIMRYLTSINPSNKLTVFVLVNQSRN